jgi:hypothetical protein
MGTVLLAIVLVALAMASIGIGVALRKRTPLRGSCRTIDDADRAGKVCETCSCHGSDATSEAEAEGREQTR